MSELERSGRWWSAELNRRTLLRGGVLGGAGLAAAALIGCGGDDDDDDSTSAQAAPSSDSATSSGNTTVSADNTTGNDSGGGATTASDEDTEDYSFGQTVRDESLPYPYQFPEPNKKPTAGERLRVAVSFDFANFDPTVSAAGGTITAPNLVYNRLLGMKTGPNKDPFSIELEPELASAWERTPDGATFTFQIRDDIKWQNVDPLNGRQFTAADVKYAFDRYSTEGIHQSYWKNIAETETPDDFTFVVPMHTVTADFILPLASRYQTIFPREIVEDDTIATRIVGTGPMILDEAEQGSHISLVKNPDYFEREVLLDGVDLRIIRDQSARLAAFRVGQLEYGYSIARTLPDLRKVLETNPDVQINVAPVVNNGIPFGMNLSNPKFQDERLRQAMTLAIDTDLMSELVFENLAKVLPLHPWLFVLDEEPQKGDAALGRWFSRYDPAEARKLLAAAGADDLKVEGIYYRYGDYISEITEITIANFKDVGIDLDSRSVDYTEFNSAWTGAKLEEATTSGWLTVGFDADNYFYNAVHSTSLGNRWQLNDPQVDAWAEQQTTILDPDERRDVLRTMWDYFLEKMFWPPNPSAIGIEVYQPWLRGIRFGGLLGTNSSYYDWGDQVQAAWIDQELEGRS